jgi:hypothetical protein
MSGMAEGSMQVRVLRAYGVNVGFRSSCDRILSTIDAGFLPGAQIGAPLVEPDLEYFLHFDEHGPAYAASVGGALLTQTCHVDSLLEFVRRHVEQAVAERAPDCVFVHAGAVAWQGKAILFPGRSGAGKSTLVSELISAGAVYMSDEYAVLDEDGLVHPFARPLSLRTAGGRLTRRACDFGGRSATDPLPVGMVVFTRYDRDAAFRPSRPTTGRALLEILRNVVTVRANPGKALRIARRIASTARILASARGEACCTAPALLKLQEHLGITDQPSEENINEPTR